MAHYFTHTAGTDIDVGGSWDAEEFDERLFRVVHPLALAFERSEDLGSTSRHLIAEMLRQFLGTHKSIRLLMKSWKEDPAGMADAMSLAREQVEKVYAVALLLEDPEPWTLRYFKDSWRKSYERHLVEAHERYALSRYEEHLNKRSDDLHEERLSYGITDKEEEFVEWNFANPPWLSEKRPKTPEHLRDAEKAIATFPGPGGTIKKLSDARLKEALIRLYREYAYLCGFAHSGFDKLLPGYMGAHLGLTPEQKQEVVDKEYAQSLLFSYLAAGFACAEAATRELPRGRDGAAGAQAVAGAELLAVLTGLWDELRETSLLGRTLYEMRVRRVLPPAVGAA